jgi:hypothetical protein
MMAYKILILILLCAVPARFCSASDWRVHMTICNQDKACAQEQAAARDLWDSQNWTPELKESCRKQYIQVYSKDYRSALACVKDLEKQRQEFQQREAYIDRKRREHKTYRTWGGVIIQ